MRYNDYNLISELCDSVIEAMTYMISTESDELLDDCIGAIEVISANVSENADSVHSDKIVPLIGKINDILVSESLTVGELNNALNDTITLKELCRNNIEYRLRVLFVAELGGKWDAMESVYKAFSARTDCDVDVVIQPIFRSVRLPDGTTRTENVYEDHLTPLGIKNIHYSKYDIAQVRPDMTFISQPYESVTTPMFHPDNIMKYSRLVYLPYFTALTLNKDASSAYDSFFRLNTQRCSWKIACQSETMKQHYKNIASEKGRNCIVSGLPKWDYVYGKNKDNVPVPEEWKKKLGGRKVFLWNTHFTSDIGEKYNDIIEFISIFANDPALGLIWRPHPMAEAIIKVYRPDLYGKYLDLKKRVSEADNMIIDQNASYLPAFVCSDALITEFSSLMEQFLLTDKPVLVTTEKTPDAMRQKLASVDGLFDFSQIPVSFNMADRRSFINSIKEGNDEWATSRRMLLNTYFPGNDGNCGERLAAALVEEFRKEADTTAETVINKVLIVGDEKDSDLCIRQLERLGIGYSVCSEYMERKGHTISLLDADISGFDLFIVTSRDVATASELLTNLKEAEKEKILDFWRLYNAGIPIMVCDRVMQNPLNDGMDGIILGISHTEVGIDASRLNGKFCNLAVSSQDLYSQFKTLEYCLRTYPDKLKKLKTVIIDLYDYNYLNYDNSLSKTAWNYLCYGGYNLEPHNFDRNKNVDITFEQAVNRLNVQKYGGISKEHIDIWTAMFADVYELNDFKDMNPAYHDLSTRKKLVTEQEVNGYAYDRGTLKAMHQDAISENLAAFEAMLNMLKELNPNIRIYTVILPKYIETEIRDIPLLSAHKGYFNDAVKQMQKKHGFTHLDFKEISDIAMNKCYYFDAAHLNYFGALKLTKQLNDIIFG